MCGIAGFLSPPGRFGADALDDLARLACTSLAHRGPDDEGTWIDAEAGVALAFRRLAIIDLSADGHQPMLSADGRFVIVYNGEIYNYRELRRELEAAGARFRSQSDTEVLLWGIALWGFEATLCCANGMFAIALWDRRERRLHLARDRLGQKPLYYGWLGDSFAFASELKALGHHPGFAGELDRAALQSFLRFGYVPAPRSIYRGLGKLAPGTQLSLAFGADRALPPTLPAGRPYWSVVDAARAGLADPLRASPEEALAEVERLLRDAVRGCMVADVPLGAFLSGGIDSSTVVALMQAQSNRPVRSFSIGFHEAGYDEARHAAGVARHLGTDHTELYVTAAEAQAVIPKLPRIYDEPFADVSQIPTYLVSQLARESVTVSLSGDGGDELFAGYNRYVWGRRLERAIALAPGGLRRVAACGLQAVPVEVWDAVFRIVAPLLPSQHRHALPGDKLHKLATVLAAEDRSDLYRRLTSLWQRPERVVIGADAAPPARSEEGLGGFVDEMILADSRAYLPEDLMTKLDRASMGVGLEGRVPFLDHRVVEFAWRLPLDLKIRDGKGKWLLRRLLARYVPEALFERPKMGFGVPIGDWLRGDLRDWAEDLLAERRLAEGGVLDPAPVRRCWQEHLAGHRNWQYQLWCVLMFEAWRNRRQRGLAP